VREALKNAYDILEERGFVDQATDAAALRQLLEEPATCYIGFDPTARSLHVGHLVTIMSLAHMQRSGHRPIALVGGGTGMVGDPSGKTEMRQMLSRDDIDTNALHLKRQLGQFLDFSEGRALLLNNADWLLPLKYIEFLRDIGCHFSVNRMLAAESYRARLETGLNFIEFNYMLLQAYDFLYLFDHLDCRIQMGGSDQWGNIVAGVDLVRRVRQQAVYGVTFPLITTASGEKMGKTAKGAVWLDGSLTSPYEYYQYWMNTDDRDVGRFLAFFTFLPMEEILQVQGLKGEALNAAKVVLAFEATTVTHGATAARSAQAESSRIFGVREVPADLLPSSAVGRMAWLEAERVGTGVSTTIISTSRLRQGIPAFELFAEVRLCASKGAARRLIQQGGGYVNGERLQAVDEGITVAHLREGQILLRAGKKNYHKIQIDEDNI
jgi:tyrosyl-tRNA synthetase